MQLCRVIYHYAQLMSSICRTLKYVLGTAREASGPVGPKNSLGYTVLLYQEPPN